MNFGKLNRKIFIKVKQAARDEYGAEVISYSTLDGVWAEKIEVTGREYYAAKQLIPENIAKFRIRYRSDFNESAIIEFDSSFYEILYIAEIGKRDGLEILAKKA